MVVNVNPPTDQSASGSAGTTEEPSVPWFSLMPRSPCDPKPVVAMAAVQNEGQFQLVATTPGGQQILAPQQQVLQPPGVMQYYITPSGALAAASPTQQVQMAYALVGNTLVPQQILTAAAPQQQYIVSQGGIQYMVGGTGGLMGLGGLGGVAVVPQGQQGLVQALGDGGTMVHAIGEGGAVIQALGGGGAIVVGGATTAIAAGDSVEGVKSVAIDNSSRTGAGLMQIVEEGTSTNRVVDVAQGSSHTHSVNSQHKTIVVDTSVAMDTTVTTNTGVAIDTRRDTPKTQRSTDPIPSESAANRGK